MPGHHNGSPSFPTRRAYGWLAAALMVFAVYASLIPFELQRVPLDTAWDEFVGRMRAWNARRIPRTDFLANILLFVPIGFSLSGALLADRTRRLAALPAAIVIVPSSLAFSFLLEFLQLFAPGRVSGPTDVQAQVIGCLLGIAAWVVAGQSFTTWLREASTSSREDRLARALAGYAALWAFVNLAPFDITVNLGALARRVKDGLITVVPFGGSTQPVSRMLWDAFATCVSAVPLGVLGLVGWTGRTARRDGRTAFAFGAALVLLMEAAQIFIRSHAADTGDVLVGWLGVSLGVWLGIRTLSRDTFSGGADMVSGWAVAALVAWCAVLCAYHWMPYDFTVDGPDIRRRLARMSLVPFAGHHSGSDINAFKDVLVKLGLSMPLGVFASFVPRVRGEASAPIVAGVMVFAALVFGVVEAGQLLLPSRVAGPTDVLIGIAGAGAGLWLGRWFHRPE